MANYHTQEMHQRILERIDGLLSRTMEATYEQQRLYMSLIRQSRRLADNLLMNEMPPMEMGIFPSNVQGERPPLSPEDLERIREVLSRKAVTDAVTANASECPQLRDLPACNSIPYGNPTGQCLPTLVVTLNAANALACLSQALQHLGIHCTHTHNVYFRYCGPIATWQQAWSLYEPAFRALAIRQGFNLYFH